MSTGITSTPSPSVPSRSANEMPTKRRLDPNWFIVALTAGLVLTGYLQWDAIKGQLKAMIDAERPWVGSLSPTCDATDNGKVGTTRLGIANSGRSPARIVFFKAAEQVFPNFPAGEPPYPNTTAWKENSLTVLLPGMTASNDFPTEAINPALFQLIKDKKARIYVYGTIGYEDPRVKGPLHTTHTCYFWVAGDKPNEFVTCPQYNDAD